jgi:hypothetical protein
VFSDDPIPEERATEPLDLSIPVELGTDLSIVHGSRAIEFMGVKMKMMARETSSNTLPIKNQN